jgi:hypothetical protein
MRPFSAPGKRLPEKPVNDLPNDPGCTRHQRPGCCRHLSFWAQCPGVQRIARLRGLLEAAAIKVKPAGRLKVSTHEADNRIYECALAARAHYIVTENTRHFKEPYKATKIIRARQLLNLLEAGQV